MFSNVLTTIALREREQLNFDRWTIQFKNSLFLFHTRLTLPSLTHRRIFFVRDKFRVHIQKRDTFHSQ